MTLPLGKYRKGVVALAGAVVLIVGQAVGLDSDLYSALVAVLTFLGVYGVKNEQPAKKKR